MVRAPSDECMRIARRWRERGVRAIGLLPVAGESVLSLAIELGAALVEQAGTNVAVVNFFARASAGGDREPAPYPLGPSLTLLSPSDRAAPDPCAWINVAMPRYGHLLVDLSGLCARGEHVEVVELLDGTALVARAGIARETDLLRRGEELPAERNLGVLLVR